MRRIPWSLLLSVHVVALVACTSSQGNDGAANGGANDGAFEWSTRAPLPMPRLELGVATVGGKIYAMGGSSGPMLARVDAYDPATNTWTQKASMHAARRGFPVGVIDGKIYVGPGLSWVDPNAVTYVPGTEVYDPTTDTWTELPPCPFAPAFNQVWGNLFFGGGAVNGRFYVVAVYPSSSVTYEYEPGTGAWTRRAAGPSSFSQLSATALGGTLYTFASPIEDVSGTLASYDPASDLWIARAGLAGGSRSAFVAANGKLYTLGGASVQTTATGQGTTTSYDAVYEYDPATAAWARRGSIQQGRVSAGAVELGGHVFVIGGIVPGTGSSGIPSAAVEEGIPR
jgi:hypothetical protein